MGITTGAAWDAIHEREIRAPRSVMVVERISAFRRLCDRCCATARLTARTEAHGSTNTSTDGPPRLASRPDSISSLQLLETGKQRTQCSAIRLVNAILERGGEVGSSLDERGQQQHGILHVDDRVSSGILCGQYATCLLRSQAF